MYNDYIILLIIFKTKYLIHILDNYFNLSKIINAFLLIHKFTLK